MKLKGWGPFIITATGSAGAPLFAGVFRPFASVPPAQANLTAAKLAQLNQQHRQQGRILGWADAYGAPGDVRYVALWLPDPTGGAWSCEGLDDGSAALQARFNALTSAWVRPAHVAMTPGPGYLTMFQDDRLDPWSAWGDLTAAKFQEKLASP
ncbi:MAG TPA: hypothetical protein VHG08_17735 [Longimicrobium sp.]|nr:hypothetical protein [Longimicrobium sp.]